MMEMREPRDYMYSFGVRFFFFFFGIDCCSAGIVDCLSTYLVITIDAWILYE